MKGYMDIIIFFFIYSCFGWGLESIYKTCKLKKIVNSGFLTGPVCPIYGIGALLILQMNMFIEQYVNLIHEAIALKVLIAILVTSLLEYVTGNVMYKAFHKKWWDYSEEKFNVKGFVCPKFSLAWGILAYVFTEDIHPFINIHVAQMTEIYKEFVVLIAMLYFIIDLVDVLKKNDIKRFMIIK